MDWFDHLLFQRTGKVIVNFVQGLCCKQDKV